MKKIYILVIFVITFKTVYTQPQPPIPIYPLNDSCVKAENVYFLWHKSNGTTTYKLSVFQVIDTSGLTDTFYIPPPGLFIANTSYYWRLKASGVSGESPWSLVNYYNTCPLIPNPPVLISPKDSSLVSITNVYLMWSFSVNAESYSIQVSTSPLFLSTIINISDRYQTVYIIPSEILNPNTRYFWRVNAKNMGGNSNWSNVWFFTTLNQIGIKKISSEIPLKSQLYNNYPNPFNPSTVIKYQLTKDNHTILKIFDILGREVEKLVDEYQKTGTYEINFNSGNLPGGVYFYTIHSGNFTDTKNMIIAK